MRFCPFCGKELPESGLRFCVHCGKELGAPDTEAAKITLPNGQEGSQQGPQADVVDVAKEEVSQSIHAPESQIDFFNKKILIPVFAGAALLAIGGGAAFALMGSRGAHPAPSIVTGLPAVTTTAPTSQTSTSTTVNPPPANKAQGSQAYVSQMDSLLAQNTSQEQQIVSTADQVNSVGPNIDDSLMNSISNLESSFRNLETQVNNFSPPPVFAQSQADFLKLIDYNITRCDSMYRGSDAWRNNPDDDSYYKSIFMEGQQAKESYQALYPNFQSEYAAAKSSQIN